jgi:uncharacterized Zn-finger protein
LVLIHFSPQISNDKDKFDALICETCVEDVEKSFITRRNIREAERFFFKPKRSGANEEEIPTADTENPTKKAKYESIDELIGELSNNDSGSQELPEVKGSAEEEHGKDVICPICKKKMSSKYYMKIHIDTMHNKKRLPSLVSKPVKLSSVDQSRPFQCRVEGCSKSYSTKLNLKQHERNVHEGE